VRAGPNHSVALAGERQTETGDDPSTGMTEYETEVAVPTRYRDVDSVGHVNNAVYVTYLEQARVEYIQAVFDASPIDPGFVVVHVSVDYERPIQLEEAVVVALRVSEIGESSITMEYEIRADDTRAATAESVIVPFDRESGTSRPVPDDWRERIESHEGRPL
jgi:acyl-CoA thioester hydrolase